MFDQDERSNGQSRNVAGVFDYYALVLSWSPSFCSTAGDRDDMQCNRADGKRYNFVLHGLWPQYTRGYPNSCFTRRKPFVPENVINGMLDIMPSRGLVIHEYKKHGTCSGLEAQGYFDMARRLHSAVRIPDKYRNPFETMTVSVGELARDFMRANPGLQAEHMAVACGGYGANSRLKEIRICFSKEGQLTACGENEDQRKLCRSDRVSLPPVRSTARDDAVGAGAKPGYTVPPPPAPVVPPNRDYAPTDPRRPLPGLRSL